MKPNTTSYNDDFCRETAIRIFVEYGRVVRAEGADGPTGGHVLNLHHYQMHAEGMLMQEEPVEWWLVARRGFALLFNEGRIEMFGATDLRLIPEDELKN